MLENLLVNTLLFAGALGVLVVGVFLIALMRRDNSVMDIAYGPLFFIAAIITIINTPTSTPLSFLIAGLTGLWAIRLSLRIYRKNKGKPEDPRYAAWRAAWLKKGFTYFAVRSFLQINVLQGAIIVLVSLPFLLAVSDPTSDVSPIFMYVGFFIFALGLGIETLADSELDAFLARKRAGKEPAVLMTTGLFFFSRRPNYFGETLIWWGFAAMVLPLPFGVVGILSPLLITYIVTKVTGPMLEKIFLEKYPAEYGEYMRTTNYFLPGIPRK